MATLQKFAAVHSSVHNHFNQKRHLYSRKNFKLNRAAEMRSIHPGRDFTLEISGDMQGSWDKARIGQVFSNLLGNAVRYSFAGTTIRVKVEGPLGEVILSVCNEGVPIPSDAIGRIFDSLTRAEVADGEHHPESVNLGIGLYITKEIVTSLIWSFSCLHSANCQRCIPDTRLNCTVSLFDGRLWPRLSRRAWFERDNRS